MKTMPKTITDDLKIKELLTRSVEKIYPGKEFLEQKLKSGEQISVYLGIDPTGPDLHLGHSVQLLTLKRFQDLGHKTILVIGDFTARIGDPSSKDATRKPLSKEEVEKNMKTYLKQVYRILPKGSFEVKYNSSWLGKMSSEEMIKLFSQVSVQRLMHRSMFRERIEKERPFAAHEFIYPLMQGYDSVAMKVDGEVGGIDQTFNMLIGRDLEKAYLDKEKFVLTTRLLVNPKTGEKMMSKTAGDYISLQALAPEMYAGVMALPDEAVFEMFELCTEVLLEKIGYLKSGSILTAKHELAYEVTKIYHGEERALSAREEFNRVFREGEVPKDIPEIKVKKNKENIVNLLVETKLAPSSSEAKRLISQNAVKVDGEIVSDWHGVYEISGSRYTIISVGPRKFVKVRR